MVQGQEAQQQAQQQGAQGMKRRHLQLITHYQHANGRYRMRVTTVGGAWQSDANVAVIGPSFDQEAAAVLMARAAVYRAETEETTDIMRWLDRSLIRLCARFATYRKDDPSSFQLPPAFSIFPQFAFHLYVPSFSREGDEHGSSEPLLSFESHVRSRSSARLT